MPQVNTSSQVSAASEDCGEKPTKEKSGPKSRLQRGKGGRKISGEAMQDDEFQACAGTLESEKSNIQEED